MISCWIDFAELTGTPAVELAGDRSLVATDSGSRFSLSIPGLEIRGVGVDVAWGQRDSILVVTSGTPRFVDPGVQSLSLRGGHAEAWLGLYREHADRAPTRVRGSYSVAVFDLQTRKAFLATDRFAVCPVCYSVEGSRLAFSDRADTVPCRRERSIDLQALYDYLYFHIIPAPRTAFERVHRLQGGHGVLFQNGALTTVAYWVPQFQEQDETSLQDLAAEFRGLAEGAVRTEADGHRIGCFLSGGTDSSTVAGTVRLVTQSRPKTYSIGFEAEGYDEMSYARIAAQHFDTDHHEYYLTADDLIEGIPKVASHYDQPFGNSSALPTYFCALLAKSDGIDKLLAGDGGDELFGGNTRYAKQKLFAAYESVPSIIRSAIVEPLLLKTPGVEKLPLVRKAASYVRQALIPLPARMNTYNLLQRLGIPHVLTAEFLSAVDPLEAEEQERKTYARCRAVSLINQMLEYDWKYTLSDNDLPKVTGTSGLAGLAVGFPLLADEIVDFSLKLRPELKVKGLRLRYFFKEALRGFLPNEIIRKKKHGFGLPFGVWLTRYPKLRAFAGDSLNTLSQRNLVQKAFLDELMNQRLTEHPGYYGEMVWILMMLEQWLTTHAEIDTAAELRKTPD